RSSSR
ncbi:hypothetical protein D021_0118B, partial [Vibrio parahaemolyticus 10296]